MSVPSPDLYCELCDICYHDEGEHSSDRNCAKYQMKCLDETSLQLEKALMERHEARCQRDEARRNLDRGPEMPGMGGKGRYCPTCRDWLMGLQNSGTHCGTCMTEVEWRPLSNLLVERNKLSQDRDMLLKGIEMVVRKDRNTEQGRIAQTFLTEYEK